jgi:hypothetical protein
LGALRHVHLYSAFLFLDDSPKQFNNGIYGNTYDTKRSFSLSTRNISGRDFAAGKSGQFYLPVCAEKPAQTGVILSPNCAEIFFHKNFCSF